MTTYLSSPFLSLRGHSRLGSDSFGRRGGRYSALALGCGTRSDVVVVAAGDRRGEFAHHRVQLFGQRGEPFTFAGRLFGAGRVLLPDTVHLTHGGVDLVDAQRLFLGCRSDLGHKRSSFAHASLDALQVRSHFIGYSRSGVGVLLCTFDHRGRVPRSSSAALGQVPDLLSDDGEPLPGLAGTRRLDRGVERQLGSFCCALRQSVAFCSGGQRMLRQVGGPVLFELGQGPEWVDVCPVLETSG